TVLTKVLDVPPFDRSSPANLIKCQTALRVVWRPVRRVMFMRNTPLRSLVKSTLVLGLLLGFGVAQLGSAQTPLPLSLSNNYLVTGDYVVGGWTKTGSSSISGTLLSTGTITIPDAQAYATNVPSQQVPPGADIVAA